MRKVFTFCTVAITLSYYDGTAQELSFDRVMTAGSAGTEMGMGIHVDHDGNVYSTGDIAQTVTFGEGGGNQVALTAQSLDAFICKQDSTGLVKWAYGIGGSGSDRGLKVTTDKDGFVYLLGYYSGTVDFDPGSGNEMRTADKNMDGFVLKLSQEGAFEWVTTFGGTPKGFDLDSLGNVYVTGSFGGAAKFGTNTITANGTNNIFVAKMDNKGQFAWSHGIGAAGARGIQQQGLGLCVDAENNVIITGNYSGTVDFNPGAATNNMSSNNNSADIFLLKLSSSGLYIWAKSIGGTDSDYGHALVADKQNNIYLTGYFGGTTNFHTGSGTLNLTANGIMDGFAAKYNANGDVVWARQFGANNMDQGQDIALDALENVYVTGYTNGNPTVDISSGTIMQGYSGNDIIILKYNNSGNFQWAKLMGGIKPPNITTYADSEVGLGIDVDRRNGSVYTTGYYQEFDIDFDPGPGTYIANIRKGADIFVHKLHCPADTFRQEINAPCDRSYRFAGTDLTTSGEYVFYYRELGRCDSITILHLTLGDNEKPVIRVNERVLSTTQDYAGYQWMLNGQLINGATNSTYTVLENGNYQVMVTQENQCTDTSEVYLVENVTSLQSHPLHTTILAYPNPVNSMLYIQSAATIKVQITSIDGKTLLHTGSRAIDVHNWSRGLYLIYLFDDKDNLIKVMKMTKE